jgi:hypothetical protein
MRRYGRYTQLHPNTTLRIVAMNSFVQDAMNSYIWDNVTDRLGQLSWLHRVLSEAEKKGESILIISHFPPYSSYAIKGIET